MTQLENNSASTQEILKSFQELVKKQRELDAQIETRAEEASRQEDEHIVERAATYSVEGIVKGLADLQLSFDEELDGLADTLTHESEKLTELKRSIHVASQQLSYLQDVQVAAEALVILEQQQQDAQRKFDEEIKSKRENFEAHKTSTTQQWEADDAEFAKSTEQFNIEREKSRRLEEERYTYDTTRTRKVETDAFNLRKLEVEREIQSEQTRLDKAWGHREAILEAEQDNIISMRERVEAFPQKLDDVRKESRESAIRKEKNNLKVQLDIMAQEMENDVQVYDLTVQSLHEKIDAQANQIRDLISQLNAASSQTQSLAFKAIEGSNTKHTA